MGFTLLFCGMLVPGLVQYSPYHSHTIITKIFLNALDCCLEKSSFYFITYIYIYIYIYMYIFQSYILDASGRSSVMHCLHCRFRVISASYDSDSNPGLTLKEPSRLRDRDVLRSCLNQTKKKKQ